MPTAQELLDQLTGQIADSVRDKVMEEIAPQIESLKTAIERLSANDPVTEQPETPAAVTAQITDTTSGEWNKGVSTQTARFLLKDTPLNRAAFVKGAKVRLGDGSTRTITSATAQYNAMFVAVDGQMLNPEQVGHPNTVAVAEPGEEVEEEPEPAKEPQTASKGRVYLNLGLGQGGESVIPGKHNTNYFFPDRADWELAASQGFKRARVGFLWERAIRGGAGSQQLDNRHMDLMIETAHLAKDVGMTILWDKHNYSGYSRGSNASGSNRQRIGSAEVQIQSLGDDWATEIEYLFKDSTTREVTYGFDIMNEPVISWDVWRQAAQHAINRIAGVAPDKVCGIEGIAYSSTINWVKNNPGMENLVHPHGKQFLEFHGHLYLDHAASGFWTTTQDKTGKADPGIGINRIKSFHEWGKRHGLKLAIGETMVPGIYPEFVAALDNMLAYNIENGIDTYVFFASRAAGGNWHNINKPENKPTLDVILDRVKA